MAHHSHLDTELTAARRKPGAARHAHPVTSCVGAKSHPANHPTCDAGRAAYRQRCKWQ